MGNLVSHTRVQQTPARLHTHPLSYKHCHWFEGLSSAIRSCVSRGGRPVSLAGAATGIICVTMFVATKHVFCRNKSMLAVTKLLSRQNCFSRQNNFCRDKHVFVTTNILFLRRKYFYFSSLLKIMGGNVEPANADSHQLFSALYRTLHFRSIQGCSLCTQESPYVLRPISQRFPHCWL